MTLQLAVCWASGIPPRRGGSGTPMIAPYEAFATRDGHLVIAAGNDRLFARLSEALGRPEWTAHARFRRNADRVQHREVLHALIEDRTRGWGTSDLRAALAAARGPPSPIP